MSTMPTSLQELLDKQRQALTEVFSFPSELDQELGGDLRNFLDTAEELGIDIHAPSAAAALTIIAQEVGHVLFDTGQLTFDGLAACIDTLNVFADALLKPPERKK